MKFSQHLASLALAVVIYISTSNAENPDYYNLNCVTEEGAADFDLTWFTTYNGWWSQYEMFFSSYPYRSEPKCYDFMFKLVKNGKQLNVLREDSKENKTYTATVSKNQHAEFHLKGDSGWELSDAINSKIIATDYDTYALVCYVLPKQTDEIFWLLTKDKGVEPILDENIKELLNSKLQNYNKVKSNECNGE